MGRYTPAAGPNLSAFTTNDPSVVGRQLVTGLRDLYRNMSETPDAYTPALFLQVTPTQKDPKTQKFLLSI